MERENIKIFRDDSGFTNLSVDLNNYLVDTHTESSPTAVFYFGYHKPLGELFVELKSPFSGSEGISMEYFDGNSFTSLEITDHTKGFKRSGFIEWSRDIDQSETEINGVSAYWYKLSFSNMTTSCEILGINLVFTNDDVIREHEPQLIDDSGRYYPDGYSSFIPFRVAARNDIIQKLRNEGREITVDGITYDLTIFDLMQIGQLKEAAKLKLISMVYFNRSDDPEDKYYQKATEYEDKYNDAYSVFSLSIDKNDDGKVQPSEQVRVKLATVRRA